MSFNPLDTEAEIISNRNKEVDLWSYDTAGINCNPELCFLDQDITTLLERDIWLEICPFLTIANEASEDQTKERDSTLNKMRDVFVNDPSTQNYENLGGLLDSRGYFGLTSADTTFPPDICERLAMGIRRLSAHGYSAMFILQYDEAWIVGDLLSSIITAASGNEPIGDWYIFCVGDNASTYKPGPPHRDRPTADNTSFRAPKVAPTAAAVAHAIANCTDEVSTIVISSSKAAVGFDGPSSSLCGAHNLLDGLDSDGLGSPMYCSVWLALTDATPETSCLYVIPRSNDPGYELGGDAISGHGHNWNDIVAQPLMQGGFLTFSHRLLHWGSTPQIMPTSAAGNHSNATVMVPRSRGRIALTLAFADPSFEKEYFDHSQYMPFPPLGLRLGIIAGQSIQYEHLAPLDKHTLPLVRRIFHQQKEYFAPEYFEKISSASQFLTFQMRQQRGR